MPVDASWSFAPVVIAALLGYACVYVWRWRVVRGEPRGERGAPVGRLVLYLGGILALVVALISPVDTLGEQLATMHMVQHLLVADIAPILLIVGLTKPLLRPVTKHVHRAEQALGPLAHPVFGVVAYVAVMWFWHVPLFYDAALRNDVVHTLEHVSFGAAGLLYWWHLLSPIRSRMRLGGLGPVMYMASTKILVGIVGMVLAFSPELLYDGYGTVGGRWGLSLLDDQHVAGLVMALEQSIVMGIALAWLFVRMLAESEREEQRRERFGVAP